MSVSRLDRAPYVGSGEDGARRSARIDIDEAETLPWGSERKEELSESARRWDAQAYALMLERVGPRPSLAQLRAGVDSEEWLAALALLELSPALAGDAAQYTEWAESDGRFSYAGDGEARIGTFHPSPLMDWEGWVTAVDTNGRGWSSTENRLFQLVAALVVPNRPVRLRGVLDGLGSWERDVLTVLVQWASGGNNRDLAARYTVSQFDDRNVITL